ncbi:helix-turn-helix domain-containing protein [Pontibacillus yanchengensis]|uniref:Helix-turn-helix domain-containing protein n=2 Tax=Pontibacillus yanchengensis TaxID=462910 RepID=A0ACC7VKS4_9BACI|nr:IclR family transcriptional regulator [Pontibacillus yanchengensis]MYL34991.1 helix-turn-helix domain-containing protein [Pontibacillus yanchengensis]MYL55297.1 helix-turn-helix domain-containing protein [Pontibacillus yanchengensis]
MTTRTEYSTTVLRAIHVLNVLAESRGPQSISEISNQLDYSQTVVHRLLQTLKSEGLIFQDPKSKLYSLGSAFLNYANKLLTDMPIAPVIDPWLTELRDKTKETVGFYVPTGQYRVCTIEYESQEEIRRSVGVGKRLPLYAGASGRAILAFQPKEMQDKIIESLSYEERSVLLEKLEQTAREGFATNDGEISPNVSALSAPVFDQKDRVIGALSISGPSFRWNKETMKEYVPDLLEATRQVSETLK